MHPAKFESSAFVSRETFFSSSSCRLSKPISASECERDLCFFLRSASNVAYFSFTPHEVGKRRLKEKIFSLVVISLPIFSAPSISREKTHFFFHMPIILFVLHRAQSEQQRDQPSMGRERQHLWNTHVHEP